MRHPATTFPLLALLIFASTASLCDASETDPKLVNSISEDTDEKETPLEVEGPTREEIKHERQVARLEKIMEREGDEYSEEKFKRYSSMKAAGMFFTILGGANLFGIIFTAVFPSDPERAGPDPQEETIKKIILFLSISGTAELALGIPLLLAGMKGKNRQLYLKRKDKILGPESVSLRFGIAATSNSGSVGLTLGF